MPDAVIPDAAASPPTIFTVGHSNLGLDAFLDVLRGSEISTIVDVRSMPYSQFVPHFNREPLERDLRAAGFGYFYEAGALGGRPDDPSCYKDGVLPEGKANFLELVDYAAVAERPWFQAGLNRAIATAAISPTALMCTEEDPLRCHRHYLIAAALIARGVPVQHIRASGRIYAAEPPALSRQLGLL
jgi:uncharacterized protein (DUF488 family)